MTPLTLNAKYVSLVAGKAVEDTFTPPKGVQAEARRALEWMKEGEAGQGFTAVGRRRAAQLANGQPVSLRTIRRMASYLARHEVDKQGTGFRPGSSGFPSPGRVAWAAWGGDPAIGWTRGILRSVAARQAEKMMPDTDEVIKFRRRARKRKRTDRWQDLIQRGVMGIDTLPGGGLVSAPIAGKAARKARSDRLAATPAPKEDRVFGSSQNPKRSASSGSSGEGIDISASTLESLKKKLDDHNERFKDSEAWRRTTMGALKSVYRRGAGAFSISHRPGMTRGQWALGRVNAFLKILSDGKPKNSRYVGDNDLLSPEHPWRKKK